MYCATTLSALFWSLLGLVVALRDELQSRMIPPLPQMIPVNARAASARVPLSR